MSTQATLALVGSLRRMAGEVEQLQHELAAVEALVTAPAAAPAATGALVTAPAAAPAQRAEAAEAPVRSGSRWQPSPAPQPWLDNRSA